jgi:Protein of unknown function (DUF3592)
VSESIVSAVIVYVLAGTGVLVGLTVFGSCLREYWAGKRAQSWPSVRGTITASGVKPQETDDGTRYGPYVLYSYSVEGHKHQGDRINFGFTNLHGREPSAASEVQGYRPGSQVTVYYDPSNPASAALQLASRNMLIPLVAGTLFTVCGLAFLFVYAGR